MDITKAKFMSIGSNCYWMAPVGDLRVHGPVDNMLARRGLFSSVSLFNGDFEKDILSGTPIERKGTPWQNDIVFDFKYFSVVHNDARTDKFKTELKRRINVFNDFCKNIHNDPNMWITYCLGQYDVKFVNNVNTFELLPDFINGIECLKKYNVLDKIIFIGNTNPTQKWNWAKFNSIEIAKLGYHYIEIDGIDVSHPERNHEQFLEIIKNI